MICGTTVFGQSPWPLLIVWHLFGARAPAETMLIYGGSFKGVPPWCVIRLMFKWRGTHFIIDHRNESRVNTTVWMWIEYCLKYYESRYSASFSYPCGNEAFEVGMTWSFLRWWVVHVLVEMKLTVCLPKPDEDVVRDDHFLFRSSLSCGKGRFYNCEYRREQNRYLTS